MSVGLGVGHGWSPYPSPVKATQPSKRLEPLLPAAKPGGRPRTVDLYEVLCAIMSVLQGGIAWRNLRITFQRGRRCTRIFAALKPMVHGRQSIASWCAKPGKRQDVARNRVRAFWTPRPCAAPRKRGRVG
ncbi:transposase [Deinococcus frigens]|uniref:transposase n=1 Tax=Deinococcus frigens TaxID=249403 RepID=UPI00146FB9DB